MSNQKDLEFLTSIIRPFFKQAHIKKTLVVILEEEITGWEKWLQIEFAAYLRGHKDVKHWDREIQHKPPRARSRALLIL